MPTHRRATRRTPRVIRFAFAVAMFLLPASVTAQQPPPGQQTPPTQQRTPEQAEMEMQMMMMGPMMSQMMQSMLKGMMTALAERETTDQLATFTKNYFDALVARGFSREEALRIVASVGIPAMPGVR